MEANEYKSGNVVVLELKGRVDEFNTKVLSDELKTIVNTGRFFIAIDLKKTNFLSANCLNEIWSCQRTSHKLGGDIILAGAEGDVLETINFVDFDYVIKRFYDLQEGIDYLQKLSEKKDTGHLKHKAHKFKMG